MIRRTENTRTGDKPGRGGFWEMEVVFTDGIDMSH